MCSESFMDLRRTRPVPGKLQNLLETITKQAASERPKRAIKTFVAQSSQIGISQSLVIKISQTFQRVL